MLIRKYFWCDYIVWKDSSMTKLYPPGRSHQVLIWNVMTFNKICNSEIHNSSDVWSCLSQKCWMYTMFIWSNIFKKGVNNSGIDHTHHPIHILEVIRGRVLYNVWWCFCSRWLSPDRLVIVELVSADMCGRAEFWGRRSSGTLTSCYHPDAREPGELPKSGNWDTAV